MFLTKIWNRVIGRGKAEGGDHRLVPPPPEAVQIMVREARHFDQAGRLNDAERLYRTVLQVFPDHAEALHSLGILALRSGHYDAAADLIIKAIARTEPEPSLHSNLSFALKEGGKFEQAAGAARRALALQPDYAEAHCNLGNALFDLGKLDPSITAARRALRLKPTMAEAHNNLARSLEKLGRLEDAAEACRQALKYRPGYTSALNNLANVLLEQGNADEAVSFYEQTLGQRPEHFHAQINLMFAQLYRPGVRPADMLARARSWDDVFLAPLQGAWPVHRPRYQASRLPRIGFVSGDFRMHAVGLMVIPAIEGLARAGYHLTCYHNSGVNDALTARFSRAAARWHSVIGLTDDAVADLIRADRIDILFDLSGYTSGNRLLVFARKPAPVQVSWAGYPGTTGLAAMDYILADRHQIPTNAEQFYREKVIRLPNSYIGFSPSTDAPPTIGPLPAASRGSITFGSFNGLKKVTPDVIRLWGSILGSLPGSRLLLKAPALTCPATTDRYRRMLTAQGVEEDRLTFLGVTSRAEHMAAMADTDIALDPLPYSGGQTTLESLWMGLPTITLRGETFAGRHSFGYLSAIGLEELAADDVGHYAEIAVTLARDPDRLVELRSGMRARMLASPLCDIDRFTRDLAAALDTMWRRKCEGQAANSFDVP